MKTRLLAAVLAVFALLGLAGFVANQVVGFDNSAGAICVYDKASTPSCAAMGMIDSVNHWYIAKTGVDNNTQLAAIAVSSTWSGFAVERKGFATVGDGGRATYIYATSACSMNAGAGDGGSQVAATAGGCWLASFGGGPVDHRAFCGSAKADYTACINAALAAEPDVLLSPGQWHVTDKVTCPSGKKFHGNGKYTSILQVGNAGGNDFNMVATGVVHLGTPSVQPGCDFDAIGITFVQPDTTVRANLIPYPPAIEVIDQPETTIGVGDGVRIAAAWQCIDLTGNSGRSVLGRIECGAFAKGLEIDGSLGFVHVVSFAESPYGMTVNQIAVYGDGTNIGIEQGRCDGCNYGLVSLFETSFNATANNVRSAGTNIANLQLDANEANLNWTAGLGQIVNLYSSKGNTSVHNALAVSGGNLSISQVRFASSSTVPDILVSGGTLNLQGGIHADFANGTPAVSVTGGLLKLANMVYQVNSNVARTAPIVKQATPGILDLSNSIVLTAMGTGSGNFVDIGNDVPGNRLSGLNGRGWGYNLPFVTSNGFYDIETSFALSNSSCAPTFATPGDFSAGTVTASGEYFRKGNTVQFNLSCTFHPTFTTAAGAFSMPTGLPTPLDANTAVSLGAFSNVSYLAGNLITAEIQSTNAAVVPRLLASNAALRNLGTSNVRSGSAPVFRVSGSYRVK